MLLLKAFSSEVIQGLTEFVSVSSSAHSITVPWAFRRKDYALGCLSFDATILPHCDVNFVLSRSDVSCLPPYSSFQDFFLIKTGCR
jgi:hypothetical protein